MVCEWILCGAGLPASGQSRAAGRGAFPAPAGREAAGARRRCGARGVAGRWGVICGGWRGGCPSAPAVREREGGAGRRARVGLGRRERAGGVGAWRPLGRAGDSGGVGLPESRGTRYAGWGAQWGPREKGGDWVAGPGWGRGLRERGGGAGRSRAAGNWGAADESRGAGREHTTHGSPEEVRGAAGTLLTPG